MIQIFKNFAKEISGKKAISITDTSNNDRPDYSKYSPVRARAHALARTLYSETTSNAQRSTSNAELVAPSISRRLAAQLDFAGNDRGVYPTAAITFSSIAIGVGNAVTLIVVRVGFGLAGPAKYSA